MKKTLLIILFASIFNHSAFAITEKTFGYQEGGKPMEGFIAYPDGLKAGAKAPAVILVHEWDGLGDYLKRRARMIAELGYVAFAADIYGQGVRAKNMDESAKLAGLYKNNRPLMRARALAALNEVRKLPEVNPNKIAVMGYCFGGTTAIELGMTGENLAAVVSFHGGLDFSTDLADLGKLKAKLLVLHGADDPTMKPEVVQTFKDEAAKDHVNLKFVSYPGAVHAFTNPEHPFKAGSPIGYNESADKKSWDEMKTFFAATLKN